MAQMVSVLQPVISSILPVVIGLFEALGTILGEMLVPLFEALGPIIEIVANFLINVLTPILSVLASVFMVVTKVLVLLTPVINVFMFALKLLVHPIMVVVGVFNWLAAVIGNVGQFIKNVIDAPLDPASWGRGMASWNPAEHIAEATRDLFTDQDLPGIQPIETPDVDAGGGGGATGTGATYRQARPITINQDISDNFFLGGDRSMRDFALMLKEEFELLGVLNA